MRRISEAFHRRGSPGVFIIHAFIGAILLCLHSSCCPYTCLIARLLISCHPIFLLRARCDFFVWGVYICSCFHCCHSTLYFSFLLLLPLLIRKVEDCLLHRWHPNLVARVLTFLDHLFVQGRPLFQSSSIFDIVPCLRSVGTTSCLPLCYPSISFSVDLCSFSQKLLVAAISYRCGWVFASSSGLTTQK